MSKLLQSTHAGHHLLFEPDVHLAPLHPRLSNQPIVPSLLSTDMGRISLITLRGVKGSVSLRPVVFTGCMASRWRLMAARDQCRLIAAISRLVDTQPSTSTSPHPRIHYGVMDHGCEIFMKAKQTYKAVRDKLGDLMSERHWVNIGSFDIYYYIEWRWNYYSNYNTRYHTLHRLYYARQILNSSSK